MQSRFGVSLRTAYPILILWCAGCEFEQKTERATSDGKLDTQSERTAQVDPKNPPPVLTEVSKDDDVLPEQKDVREMSLGHGKSPVIVPPDRISELLAALKPKWQESSFQTFEVFARVNVDLKSGESLKYFIAKDISSPDEFILLSGDHRYRGHDRGKVDRLLQDLGNPD
jgi:hypothetical protein